MNKESILPTAIDCSLRLLTVAALGLTAGATEASDFYKLTIIAESSQQAGTDWRILGRSSINGSGLVTWQADRFVNGAFESGIFIGDGNPTSTPAAPGSPIALGTLPAINSAGAGQVRFQSNSVLRRWDRATGTTADLYNCNQAPNPGCPDAISGFSDNGRITLLTSAWQILEAAGPRTVLGATLPSSFANSNNTHVISRGGRNAAAYGRNTTVNPPTAVIGALDSAIPNLLGLATIGPLATWNIASVSPNDLGNIAFLSHKGSTTTFRPFVGVVNPRTAGSGLIRIADDSDGRFSDFGAASRGAAINNLNEVAFPATLTASVGSMPFVGDISGRPPTQVASLNEPIPNSNGAIFVGIQQNGVHPHALNERGSFAFDAVIRRAGTNLNAVVRADPVVGVSPGNPIMPETGNPLPSGWRFPLTCPIPTFCTVVTVSPGSGGTVRAPRTPRRYIDPQLAVGYTYQVEAPGPNFASVYIPAPLPNGDDTFQVEFNGQVAPLKAGEEFDFTAVVPGGVSTFRITGIDTTEALDPASPTAFVTGLTFAADSTTDYSVTMVPIVADPDDTDLDGVPNAADLCPNTAAGATVDANGCAANQRDSDGDGVVDSLDQCPATPIGTPVDANGCSALQLDADGDGVPNTADACPGTVPGAAVDTQGCSAAQRDSDGDGVNDGLDQCPNTPPGSSVNAAGCATSQLDADGDGVPDSADQCPNTAPGASVNAAGCSTAQLDSDGDGVPDSVDQCPGTAPGTTVDTNGCPLTTPAPRCDVNGDNFIDYRDIRAIILAIGKPASGATDPRDANGNGKIELVDAAICTTKCSRLLCLPPR